MEQQLNSQQFSKDEKKIKESELNIDRKLLTEREKELTKLRKQEPNNSTNTSNSNDNSKVNWAIGLGIATVIISLLCFILLLRKRNQN